MSILNFGSKDKDDIFSLLISYFDLSKEDIIKHSRKNDSFGERRDIIIYFLREYGEMSFPAIGVLLDRDHSTIIYSYKKVKSKIKFDEKFQTKFETLIEKVKLLKKRKIHEKQALFSKISTSKSFFPYLKKSKTNFKFKEISNRNMKILQLYREGLTLEKIGSTIKLTRERVRQIINCTIKQIAINESVSKGTQFNYVVALNEEKNKRKSVINKDKPIKIIKQKTWSRYHLACESCKTIIIPHFRNGLCENCGGRSISGEVRENMINEHKNKCDYCGISRDEAHINYGRDFYLSRLNKSVLCKKCHMIKTGKKLGDLRKKKWRTFYK